MIIACRDRDGWLIFVMLGDGSVRWREQEMRADGNSS
jgi:hypothetical protein